MSVVHLRQSGGGGGAGGGLDEAAADLLYLRLDCANDPLTATLQAQSIDPDGDDTYDLGTNTNRWRELTARRADIIDNAGGNATRTGASNNNSVIGGRTSGPGSNTLQMGAPQFPPIGLFGNIYTYYASCTARMRNSGGGSFMAGSAFAYRANDNAFIDCDAGSFGSFTGGYAYPYYGSSATTIQIRNQAAGAFIWAYPAGNGANRTHLVQTTSNGRGAFVCGRTLGTSDALIQASQAGAFVHGFLNGNQATRQARLIGSGQGSFTQGFVNATGAASNPEINGQGSGAFAQGAALSTGIIRASGTGSLAHGEANDATMLASARGSFCLGLARTSNNMTASGFGAGAIGDSANGPITASAANSFQFGPGVNAQALSLAVGDMAPGSPDTGGIRLIGGGAPGTPVNGDIWHQNGYVYIRSNGVSVQI